MSRDGFETLHSNSSASFQSHAVRGPGAEGRRGRPLGHHSPERLDRGCVHPWGMCIYGSAFLSPFPRWPPCRHLSWGATYRPFLLVPLQTPNCPSRSMVVPSSPWGWRRISLRGECECLLTPGSELWLTTLSWLGTFPWSEGSRVCLTYFVLFRLHDNPTV